MGKVDELYERLLERYSALYVMPKLQLERRISELQERGYSREEAVRILYEETFGPPQRAPFPPPPPPPPKAERGVLDLMPGAFNAYTHSPCLVLAVLLKDSLSYVSSAAVLGLMLYLISEAARAGGTITLGAVLRAIVGNARLIACAAAVGVVVVLVSALSSSVYWAALIRASLKLMRGERAGVSDLAAGVADFPRVVRALLLAEALRSLGLVPLAALLAQPLLSPKALRPRELAMLLAALAIYAVLSALWYAVTWLLTLFTPHEVILRGKSAPKAVAGSLLMARRAIGDLILYALLALTIRVCAAAASAALAWLHVSIATLASFAIAAVAKPVLDVSITGVYALRTGRRVESWRERAPLLSAASRYLRAGVRELARFVRDPGSAPFVALAAASLAASWVVGDYLGRGALAPLSRLLVKRGRLSPFISETLPVSVVWEVFLNNWKVAAMCSLGGFFHVVPPLAALVNGLVLGLVTARLEPLEAAILIAPHGAVELPAFVLSVAAGMRLSFYLATRREGLTEALRRAALIAVGLAIPLLAAAVIEAFVTPQLARAVLGWR